MIQSAENQSAAFQHALKLHADGSLEEAEQNYRRLLQPGELRKDVLSALADLYLQSGRPVEAADTLAMLTEELPDSLSCYAQLAMVLDGLGQTEAAISHYQRLLSRQPDLADAHYNVALLYKKAREYSNAISAYEHAIRLGIEHVQEVYLNIGVLYSELHQPGRCEEYYESALSVDPGYIPAMFNLGGLREEQGNRKGAIELYNRILEADPYYWDALSRLAYCRRVLDVDDELIGRIEVAISRSSQDSLGQESLYFALGKTFDDIGLYDKAFAAYREANNLGRRRNPPYDRTATEQAFELLIGLFDSDWISSVRTRTNKSPIFICGMFRSGSTLVEQILAEHPAITAGDEMDVLPWLIGRKLAPYPHAVKSASREKLQQISNEYITRVREIFPDSNRTTDKRPDNYLHLGLIKVLFPAAKIIHTKRNKLDNCLSIYFQQLGGSLGYATELEDIAHYREQHDRLMRHWDMCFGEDIFTVDYDELVCDPEPVLRELTSYLNIDWDDSILTFEATERLVKTASVWQVRDELHSLSSGRWKNYESYVQSIS